MNLINIRWWWWAATKDCRVYDSTVSEIQAQTKLAWGIEVRDLIVRSWRQRSDCKREQENFLEWWKCSIFCLGWQLHRCILCHNLWDWTLDLCTLLYINYAWIVFFKCHLQRIKARSCSSLGLRMPHVSQVTPSAPQAGQVSLASSLLPSPQLVMQLFLQASSWEERDWRNFSTSKATPWLWLQLFCISRPSVRTMCRQMQRLKQWLELADPEHPYGKEKDPLVSA